METPRSAIGAVCIKKREEVNVFGRWIVEAENRSQQQQENWIQTSAVEGGKSGPGNDGGVPGGAEGRRKAKDPQKKKGGGRGKKRRRK